MTDAAFTPNRPHAEVGRLDDDLRTVALNKVSWGAILAGVVLALTVQLLLNLLGVGIGAAVIDPAASDNAAASTFSLAGAGWYVAAGLIGAFVGGFVASRLSGSALKSTGGLHGLTSWAVTTLVILYLVTTSAGALVGGAFSGLGSVLGGFGRTAGAAVQTAAPALSNPALANIGNPLDDIEQQVRGATGGNDPEALRQTAMTAVRSVLTGDQAEAEAARTRAADALARAQNIPADQARAQIGQYEERYRATVAEAKQQATDAAVVGAKVVSRGAIVGFIALLLGAVAAFLGGRAGAPAIAGAVRR